MAQFQMTSTMFRLAVVAWMVLGLGLCSTIAAAAETEEYPVWWSPAFELQSLDKIDERLRRQFWLDDDGGVPMYRIVDGNEIRAEPENCVSLENKWAEGYWGLGNNNHQLAWHFMEFCKGLRMLQDAKPAKVSFLRDFVMTSEALDFLPAMADPFASCGALCRQHRANKRRIPLSRFQTDFDYTVKVPNPLEIERRTKGSVFRMEILGRGDFNDDDLDDLLVIASAFSTEGTYGTTSLFLLGREAPNAVLWVINADEKLCPDYRCEGQYDESDEPH